MVEFTRRKLMATSLAASLGASVAGVVSADEDADTPKAPSVDGKIERFATTALGAEVTGPEVTKSGTLFFSLQHPSRKNPEPFNSGGIGYVSGYNIVEDSAFDELGVPSTDEQQSRVRVANGEYVLLAREGDNIGENADLGVPTTPDGIGLDEYPGPRYGNLGYNPDCNRFIPLNEEETEGYLFTNFEQSPGEISRIPISQDDDGEWEADLDGAANLASTEAFRDIGGTRINCYGDISPWNTYLSAEEEYSHPRLSLTATTSDIVEAGSGVGLRGAAQFYNRPNPTEVGSTEWAEEYNDGAYLQGSFALSGLELQAYYLGADAVDQNDDLSSDVDIELGQTPIDSPYPNPYRYGYIVDFRDSDGEEPMPMKYYVGGRAAWECPDVQADEKTMYLSSDGDNKGFYKFVADDPIPSYDDPMDVQGTLYAVEVTNEEAAKKNPPGNVDLELDWIPLGHATNAEVESWVAEYDDVSQVDYLESHADTDWEEDFETAIAEADREVAENGNADYISDEDIVSWAEQYAENGPEGVDEDLRRVPFLETRAAAKEVGATVEFRKSEGIDSKDDAQPGDYIYVGISEVNDGMTDDEGALQLDRVDGGLVYRAEIEDDYNISTLEPVIVGADATDTADVADDALLNIDNVFVLNDGRVLCCEDADQFRRSYPNDCLYVYTPEGWTPGEGEGDEDDDRGHGNDDGHDDDNPGNGKAKGRGRGRGDNEDDEEDEDDE
ncbi:cell surface protein [Haloprofundus marisrubri]|uniref:Cell surface protein n=1 Tax=Haloprofundus marisrubri TaxID=1514971 RepID=A0A0W1R8S1_9EURY|nr:alkaline phosphatase PhoX [Haloprofundus marisrubri]KTG09447.1 cell surface protein [Haloprofundus marisrubri]